jgi:hypothetical protein
VELFTDLGVAGYLLFMREFSEEYDCVEEYLVF